MLSNEALQILRRAAFSTTPVRRPLLHRRYCASCETPNKSSEPKAASNIPVPPADHRQLAIDQELFTTSIYSPGSPLFLPNGARIFNKLTAFLRTQYEHYGFQEVITPTIYKKSLWEKSGHWENYAEDMFSVTGRGATGDIKGKQIGEDEEFGLKPMNCPGHCLMFASKQRSFRDLPIRFADFSPLHRNELSGALSGLTRVRRFHQDDGHIFCRPSQVAEEISKTLDFVKLAYETFNLGPYRLALSTRPKDHFIGSMEDWENAESALREALDTSGQVWTVNEGDGAFYGPKIDIILKDSDGKEHQTATIQLDFQLPKRFELEYIAPAPDFEQRGKITTDPELLATSGPVRPVMVHRAILGSVERFMALLIEHYNGKWPFWLNPRQIMIITVSDDPAVVGYANHVKTYIQGGKDDSYYQHMQDEQNSKDMDVCRQGPAGPRTGGFAIDIDATPRSVKKKISEAKRKHYSIIAVVGNDNMKVSAGSQSVNVDTTGMSTSPKWLCDRGFTSSSGEMRNARVNLKALRSLLMQAEHEYL